MRVCMLCTTPTTRVGSLRLPPHRCAFPLRPLARPCCHVRPQRFKRVLEAAPSGILMIDGGGHIVLANVMAEQLFGYPSGTLLGTTIGT